MSNLAFAIILTNPFDRKPIIFYKACRADVVDDIYLLLQHDTIVAFNFDAAIEGFRKRGIAKLPKVVDVTTAIKLINGQPKSRFREGNEPWSIKRILGSGVSGNSHALLEQFRLLKLTRQEFVVQCKAIISELMDEFEKKWNAIRGELEAKGEYDRYSMVENEIYNIFLRTRLNGILVPKEKLYSKLYELNKTRYSSLKELEFRYNYVGQRVITKMFWEDIQGHTQLDFLANDFNYDFWKTASDFAESCTFIDRLVSYYKSQNDYNALLRYTVDEYQRIYPRYDIMGTVTGRILVESPGVQYLKKTSRSIFSPDEGMSFLYADFDQFEPGIMASLSCDQSLINMYNDGDVYTQLAFRVFGANGKRKMAKILFLAYMYGMRRDKLLMMIEKLGGAQSKDEASLFFSKFPALETWKKNLLETVKVNGYASSKMGNSRYIDQKGHLSPDEERWIPSQVVQGTASLIFKRSIIRLHKEADFVQFLIPMHDGILVQVPNDLYLFAQKVIQDVFCGIFNELCPQIKARVSFESFHK